MSRGGWRYGAGRPASHSKTDRYLALDVRALQRKGFLAAGSTFTSTWSRRGKQIGSVGGRVPDGYAVHLDFQRDGNPEHVELSLRKSVCHYGGRRPWFICPRCQRRAAIIYLAKAPGCRECLGLRYQSQSEDLIDRSWRRTGRIMERLGREISEGPRRPKWMRHATHKRLFEAWCREEQFRDEAISAFLAQREPLFPRFSAGRSNDSDVRKSV